MSTPAPAPTVLTGAERAVLGAATVYARRHDLEVPPEEAYLSALPDARRSILDRFAGGLLRDAPDGVHPSIEFPADDSTLPADASVPLAGVDGDRLLCGIEPLPDGTRSVRVLAFPGSDAALLAPIAAEHGYGRLAFVGALSLWSDGESDPVDHPAELVPLLEREGAFADAEQASLIESELEESAANLAFARLAGRVWAADCAGVASVDGLAERVSGADPAASLERLSLEGHPFHHGAKIRRGMDASAALASAPEFTGTIALRFAAVDTDYAKRETAGGERLTQRLFSLFDGIEEALWEATPAGRSPEEYAVVPIHPWQFSRALPDRYREQFGDGRVLALDYTHPVTPLSNLRTVVPYQSERTGAGPHPHLKLAIEVRTTNATRTLSPQAVHNGPRVTAVLRAAAEDLEGSLGFLDEHAATCYHAPGGPHPDGEAYDDARSLSGLLRTNPHGHPLVGDALPIAASSLISRSPASGRPLVADLVAEYRETTGGGVTDFFEQYVGIVIPDQLRLLSAYGIALESHAQNSLVAFESGRPVAALVRDFGGVRVHTERLAEQDLRVETYPDSDVRAAAERDCYRKLHYALFQNHLSELIVALVDSTGIEEERCWGIVRAECDRTFDDLRADSSIPDGRVERDAAALFSDPAEHKALTAMRLEGKRHEYAIARVPNPLAR